MPYPKFSIEQKKTFFLVNKWGEKEDYDRFYQGDGFPDREIIKNLTNDELVEKYLKWIDENSDKDANNKYFGGHALHSRFEMGRRLREGIEKFELKETVLIPSSAFDTSEVKRSDLEWELASRDAKIALLQEEVAKANMQIGLRQQMPGKLKVAPLLYEDKYFKEVDKLAREGLKKGAALQAVAEKYSFSPEGFKQQYYKRWHNRKMKRTK